MRIDLHTHSLLSDGTDEPATLMEKAAAAGLDVVALTDHDMTHGWAEAQEAADRVGIRLVRGLEISTDNRGRGQHLLGYGPDPDHPALAALLASARSSREEREPLVAARLAEHGLHLDLDAVRALRGRSMPSKKHIARVMASTGLVAREDDAYDQWLNDGRPAAVDRPEPRIEDAIAALSAAGGVAVLAHPWTRGKEDNNTEERIAELADGGLVGLEVDHPDHDAADRDALGGIARNLGLVVTGSSDHHGTHKEGTGYDLGSNTTDPEQLARLEELMGGATA